MPCPMFTPYVSYPPHTTPPRIDPIDSCALPPWESPARMRWMPIARVCHAVRQDRAIFFSSMHVHVHDVCA